ncbi:hypothetical protein ACH4Q6_02385 [Streptomyces lydicus]|uniref:hypothetical protein n=1 Tax=Streptomyces lydicus TaxID=47763 RepID=UPI0037A955C5
MLVRGEPVCALDVTTRAQVREVLGQLRREPVLSPVLIAHDPAVVRAAATGSR